MKEIIIELDEKQVTITKLPIGKYAELLKAIKKLPDSLQTFQDLEKETLLKHLPELIATSLPDFIGIITVATDLKKEEVEKLGLDEVVKIVLGIVEVNNYKEVYEMIKKALARPETKEETKA